MPVAVLAHACAARTRLSFAEHKGQTAFFETLCDATLALPGVRKVEGRPMTGSLIITHDGTLQQLTEEACKSAIFEVSEVSEAKPQREAEDWQQLAASWFAGSADKSASLRMAAVMALLGMAAIQVGRGQIMPPATTSLWYALSLLMGSGPAGDLPVDGGDGE